MRAQLRGFRVLMAFSFGAAPLQATLFLLSGALMSLTMVVPAWGAKLLIDAVQARSLHGAYLAAAVLAVVGVSRLINTLYYVDLLFTVAEKAGAAIDRRLIDLMAGIPGIDHHERPEYLDRLDVLREERSRLAWMTNATAGMVRVAVALIASAALLAQVSPVLLLLPLVGFLSLLLGRKSQSLEIAATEETAEGERLRRHLFEVGTAAAAGKEIRVFGMQEWLAARHDQTARQADAVRDRAAMLGAVLGVADSLISAAAYAGAIGLVLVRAIEGTATAGDVVLVVGLAASMNAIVMTAVLYGTQMLRVLGMAQRYLWLVDFAASKSRRTEPVAMPARLTRGIELRDVSFRYPETEATVLDDLSLHLPAGAVVALVGENGAGKTTLAKLLCGFYEPSAGAMMADDVDLRRVDPAAWRSRVSAAFQDLARFELLARETVGVADLPRIEDGAAVIRALERAGATDLPAALPAGLETQLGRKWEGGIELSGGQWQKLALGRATMRPDPLLLVLDEPAASLDPEAEHALFERYAQAARESARRSGTITLLITHRFSTVRMADLIVVLERGRIREIGPHDALIRAGGLYAELYEMQARAYR